MEAVSVKWINVEELSQAMKHPGNWISAQLTPHGPLSPNSRSLTSLVSPSLMFLALSLWLTFSSLALASEFSSPFLLQAVFAPISLVLHVFGQKRGGQVGGWLGTQL